MSNDPRTGREIGDHGTANQAIEFAIDVDALSTGSGDPATFLRHWREGDLDEWPEFYTWLAEHTA